MDKPRVMYGPVKVPDQDATHYVLMKAGITDGVYSRAEFVEKLKGVPQDSFKTDEARTKFNTALAFNLTFVQMLLNDQHTISVENFKPDQKRLEEIMNK